MCPCAIAPKLPRMRALAAAIIVAAADRRLRRRQRSLRRPRTRSGAGGGLRFRRGRSTTWSPRSSSARVPSGSAAAHRTAKLIASRWQEAGLDRDLDPVAVGERARDDPRQRTGHGDRRRPLRHQGLDPGVRRRQRRRLRASPSCSSSPGRCRRGSPARRCSWSPSTREEARGDRDFDRDGTRGSRQYVEYARAGGEQGSVPLDQIRAMVLFDLVGDCDLQIPYEPNSDQDLYARLRGRRGGALRRSGAVSVQRLRGRRRPRPVRRGGDPRGRPDRLRLRPRRPARRVLAHPGGHARQGLPGEPREGGGDGAARDPPDPLGAGGRRPPPGYPLGVPEGLQTRAPKRVLLAAPRGYCAGVDRAVQTVEHALDMYGPPVYVRKEIVHNKHVVEQLAERGAIFVEEETEVPEGELVVFSAHGVAPSVHANAAAAQPAHDRRHLPAGDQGPRRGAQVRRAGLHDRPHRPPGPRGGRGDHRRGAREHRPGRDGRRRRRARAPRPRPRRLHHPDDALGRRDRRDHRPPARALPQRSPRRSPTTSVTRPPTARSRSSSSPASASWCW